MVKEYTFDAEDVAGVHITYVTKHVLLVDTELLPRLGIHPITVKIYKEPSELSNYL